MVNNRRKISFVSLFLVIFCPAIWAQKFEVVDAEEKGNFNSVWTRGFWVNWFVQVDLDMSLQNPYGYDFSKVFPNGKSFGLDVAIGKWFSPQVGYRGKFNWENKLPLLKNDHANWLAPFDEPGVNREKGGYIGLYGDLLVNMHNLFGTYKPERIWNLSAYPRVGLNYNFGVSKGSLLLGLGILNTYRINERWSLIGDIAYIMTGSGFVGADEVVDATGTGSNSNGYFSIGIGTQVDLGPTNRSEKLKVKGEKSGVITNGIWDNWFVQVGADMSLMNPYGCNFLEVFPKGNTFGLNVVMGKWFTPEFAVRGRVQWENGLIENKSIEWVPPTEDPKQNYKSGGFATATFDCLLNLTNVFCGYDANKKWHTNGFVRAGLISQFEIDSKSPLAGVGIEQTYRLNDRLSLFGSLGYQVTTSESSGGTGTGMEVSAGSNGFFDIDFGIKYDLGQNLFYRTMTQKGQSLSQQGQSPLCHNWPRFAVNTVASVAVAYVGKTALKAVVNEERPDHSDNKSFPSGHASMAFAAARSIDKEFRKDCIWIPIAGYAAATAVGVERVVNDHHHWYDVVAGAALGFGSAELTWWLSDKLFPNRNVAVGLTGNAIDVKVEL